MNLIWIELNYSVNIYLIPFIMHCIYKKIYIYVCLNVCVCVCVCILNLKNNIIKGNYLI